LTLIHLAPWQWALGAACGFLVGVAKTGVPGLGIVVVPLMVLAVGDAKLAAGWLLPILCTADIFAVIAWRRHAAAKKLFSLAPWVLAGMAAGAVALTLSEHTLRIIVGTIVLLMLAAYLLRRHAPGTLRAAGPSAPYGITAGFATTVANAAGPVMNLYLLSKRLKKDEFIATGAWFFFIINLTKVPIYTWHGLISQRSLAFDATLIPIVLVGATTGRWLVARMSDAFFEFLVVSLTAASTLLLFV
jgi:uncharacterized membrane protein YfcA